MKGNKTAVGWLKCFFFPSFTYCQVFPEKGKKGRCFFFVRSCFFFFFYFSFFLSLFLLLLVFLDWFFIWPTAFKSVVCCGQTSTVVAMTMLLNIDYDTLETHANFSTIYMSIPNGVYKCDVWCCLTGWTGGYQKRRTFYRIFHSFRLL